VRDIARDDQAIGTRDGTKIRLISRDERETGSPRF
jgi:hypothetical protein